MRAKQHRKARRHCRAAVRPRWAAAGRPPLTAALSKGRLNGRYLARVVVGDQLESPGDRPGEQKSSNAREDVTFSSKVTSTAQVTCTSDRRTHGTLADWMTFPSAA